MFEPNLIYGKKVVKAAKNAKNVDVRMDLKQLKRDKRPRHTYRKTGKPERLDNKSWDVARFFGGD